MVKPMTSLSDEIEGFLKRMLEEASGRVEIRRQRLAARFGCAPSQINYVLETRFTVDRGYSVESRRGGRGYIRIVKFSLSSPEWAMEYLGDRTGDLLTQREAEAMIERLGEDGCLSLREVALMKAVVNRDSLVLDLPYRDRLRAALLKRMLAAVLSCPPVDDRAEP